MDKTYKIILLVSIFASFVVFLDGSAVNVALLAISKELGGGTATQQWVVDAYLLGLGSFILLAGSLSDLLGRRRILQIGLIGFLVTSLLCAAAPTGPVLIIARLLQGIAGALIVPSSLALIMAAIKKSERGRAIGAWTAWSAMAGIAGPLVGGLLVDAASWRLIFAINIIPIVICLLLLRKVHIANPTAHPKIDYLGAVLCSVGLGGIVFALIEQVSYGWASPLIIVPFAVGLLCLLLFIYHEKRTSAPMLPLNLFAIRNFAAGNLATIAIYAALSIGTFILAIYLQQVGGLSATIAGLALLPVTIVMFFFSKKFGDLAGTYGPRLFMTVGPILAGVGFLLMATVVEPLNYWIQLLPGIILFAVGLSITVAPLTSAVLADVDTSRSGVASAINNAVSRIAGLIGVAIIGLVIGTQITTDGFRWAVVFTAALLILGGLISLVGIRNAAAKAG